MKDLKLLNYFLGLEVSFYSNKYNLSQAKYASYLLTRSGFIDFSMSSIGSNVRLTSFNGVLLENITRSLSNNWLTTLFTSLWHPYITYFFILLANSCGCYFSWLTLLLFFTFYTSSVTLLVMAFNFPPNHP